ncbi:uroporphyrinogen-III synthase [Neisseria sp. HSC-16F19]|nr:uroporphyrinogen-III synthase [Neisseria sp. HSC-16F19]MCP2039476.1 uroporphyrinogen-III synthase [Neisseria sp. HSC-16F19]
MHPPGVLLLRPEVQAQQDAALCRQAGWQPLLMPLLVLDTDTAALARLPQQWQAADTLFWVSPGAVDAAAALLTDAPPALAHVAVGAATAARLQAYGIRHVWAPTEGGDSEAVLRLAYWQRPPGRLLVVRGDGGRAYLGDVLRERGWQVDYAGIYRRRSLAADWVAVRTWLHSGSLTAVQVTTAAMAADWLAQMPADLRAPLQSLLYFAQHERVAAVLRASGITHIRIGSLAACLRAGLPENEGKGKP